MLPTDRLLTADEAATLLRVSRFRLYQLARDGILPCVKLGRAVRFSPAALEAFIEAGGRGLGAGWKHEATTDANC